MTTVEKIAMGVIAVGMASVLFSPENVFIGAIKAAGGVFQGSLGTAMGRAKS